jgi:hypothetical protein
MPHQLRELWRWPVLPRRLLRARVRVPGGLFVRDHLQPFDLRDRLRQRLHLSHHLLPLEL